ncbi:MAG: VOC family protein [Pseudomonadota bacterium]
MAGAVFDHVVVGAKTLEEGIQWTRERLGIDIPRGGEHVKMGTHNCVMRLDGEHYFEVIAINPNSPDPLRARWFSLDNATVRAQLERSPQLLTWAVNTSNVRAAFSELNEQAAFPDVNIEEMTRDDLRWLVAFAKDGEMIEAGLFPLVIEWHVPQHPSHNMAASGCRLINVEILSPQPDVLQARLSTIGALGLLAGGKVQIGDQPELRITLDTPNGPVLLSNNGGSA